MIYLILVLGIAFRLVSLNQSLWLDEATSALVAKMPLADIFTRFLPGDFHPPVYYLILKYWGIAFGYSEISLRIPSVIFGIGAVYVTYLIAEKLFNKRIGLISALLMSTSGLSIYYSQEARMYMLAVFLVSLAVYWFLEKKWPLFSVALALIGMTDYVSLFIVPVFFIVGWKDRKKLTFSTLPLVVIFLAWSPVFLRQLSGGLSLQGTPWWNILGVTTLKNIVLIPVKFVLGRISFDNITLYSAIVAVAFSLFGNLINRVRSAPRILWAWLIVPVVLGIFGSFRIPTLIYFRFIFCLPALYILISAGIEKGGKYKIILLGLVLIVNVLSAGYYLLNAKFHREDWRAAAVALGPDKIVFPSDSHKEGLIYYGKGSQIVRVYDIALVDTEIWLSRYVWEISDPTDSTRLKIQNLGYNKTAEYDFNGVVFWKYNKNQYAHRN